ncbi:MAG: aminotransferase class V-fold PLP-dependent enzyme [Alphaproteobacteria bacterium]|nr:aminotransferase class V-fold PLP-dependent enzyme [Alphaproteobacteria bacterium]
MPDFGQAVRHFWTLDWNATHLNHGSYGATPKPVLAAQDAVRQDMERTIGDFFTRQLPKRLRATAAELGEYLGAAGEDVVFVDNATAGVQSVIGSIALEPGDEILINDQTYNAVKNIVRHEAARAGAKVVEVTFPFPVEDDGTSIVGALKSGLNERTRLVVLDHITSATAVVMPIERLIAACRAAGALVLVDGAHAPGQVPLDLSALDADFYTGNCHKWLSAPKGAAFLWSKREHQPRLHPPVVSHGLGKGYVAEFDWTGTRDPSPYLSVPAALAFRQTFGDSRIKARNRALAEEAGTYLADAWKTRLGAPAALAGSMRMIRLPLASGGPPDIRLKLWQNHRIDVPVNALDNALWVRVSAQLYNEMDDYRRLAIAVRRL